MRRRLWQLSALLAMVTLILFVANGFLPEHKSVTRQMLGHDFLAFYTAGTFVREGRVDELYDLQKVAAFQLATAKEAGLEIDVNFDTQKFGPWWNPPFYAWVFAPLSLLSFQQGVAVWTMLNILALGGAIVMLVKMIAPRGGDDVDTLGRPLDWRTSGLVPFLLLLSMPFVQAISHGQNTLISLCILCGVVMCWRAKRALLAGALCALLGYKPQLAAVVAMVLVCSLGIRALVGLCFVGSAMVLMTQLTLPGTLVDYLHRLPANVHYMQVEHAYLWERHATLKGFWRLLIQGRDAGEMGWLASGLFAASFIAVAALLARAVWSQVTIRDAADVQHAWSRLTDRVWRDRLIAATICCAPLLMPFYFDYDLLLLSIPAVLFAVEDLSRPADEKRPRWLAWTWVGLYAWMLINPGMSLTTHVNLNVILLTCISVGMVLRATRVATPVQVAGRLPTPAVTLSRRAA